MSARDEVLVGGRQLDDILSTFAPKLHKNIMRGGLRAGCVPIKAEVEQRIPEDTGQLRASTRITTRFKNGTVSASVKVGNFVAWYAHLVEFGTNPHVIKPKREGSLSFGGRTVEQVNHPGTTGRPFMRPAAEAAFQESVKAVETYVRKRITKQGINVPAPIPADPEE